MRVWEPSDACSKWSVSATPAGEHAASVEDVQWSPRDRDTLASVSADRSLRIWDVRVGRGTSGSSTAAPAPALAVADAHRADINVLHWNPLKPEFLLTGGDDGFLRIWDNRLLKVCTRVYYTAVPVVLAIRVRSSSRSLSHYP